MIRKTLFAIAALALALAAASYYSPHWTVHRMRGAIEARDVAAFSSHVDFPALRDSVKRQLAGVAPVDPAGGGQSLDALARGLLGAVAAPVIDLLLRPAALIEMLNAGTPRVSQAVLASTITQVPHAATTVPDMQLDYRDWHTVVYRRRDAAADEGSFLFRRHGLWSWRLAGLELAR